MTLMELAVVMGLISLLLFTAMPRFLRSDRITDVDQAVRRLAALVSQLKEEAVRTGRLYVLHIDMDQGRLWTTIGQSPSDGIGSTAAADATVASDAHIVRSVLQLPESISRMSVRLLYAEPVDSGLFEIRFFPQGYSYGATIRLEGRDGRSRCLRIEPFLGEPVVLTDIQKCAAG